MEEDLQVGDDSIKKPSQLGSGVSSQGDGVRKVLMEIPEEYYEEDQKRDQDKITAVEKEIRRNSNKPSSDGLHGKVLIS